MLRREWLYHVDVRGRSTMSWSTRQSSSLYLAFLAAIDNTSLVFILAVWFGWIGVHIFHKDGWCQTIHYCTYVCSFLSAWTVVKGMVSAEMEMGHLS